MASNDKTGPDNEAVEGSWSPRRSKASSSKLDKADKKANASPDPDALVEDIEKTREELAETLDAIADKVSPKRVTERTKKKVKDGTAQAADTVKEVAGNAADNVKEAAGNAADAVKEGVAAVKEKVGDDSSDPARSPLAPATSVEVGAVSPLPGAEVPLEPAPTPGALADAAYTPVAPAGAETTPIYTSSYPRPSRVPAVAGAGAALLVVLLVLRRRRR